MTLEDGRNAGITPMENTLNKIHWLSEPAKAGVFQLSADARELARAAAAAGLMVIYVDIHHAHGKEDFLDEVCPSQLVLGRALMERDRLDEAEECFRAADAAAEQLASIGHRTEAWVALGDLAARRGDDREASRLYRNAAEALQEIRF